MSKFKFRLLTGTDPQAQYDAIGTYDSLTFYLLSIGKGYLGSTLLFDGDALSNDNSKIVVMTSETLSSPETGKLYALDNVAYNGDTLTGFYFYNGVSMQSFSDNLIDGFIADMMVESMTGDGYTGDNDTIPTTKAVIDLISNKLSDSNIVNAAFFRKVESVTVDSALLARDDVSFPSDVAEGDVGLLFMADTNGTDDGDEAYYFISLADYVTSVYDAEDSDSIKMTLDSSTNKFKAELNVASTENSIVVDTNGVSLLKTNGTINDGDGTDEGGETPSSDKLVTESDMVNYIQNSVLTAVSEAIEEALSDVITYVEDDGTIPPVTS